MITFQDFEQISENGKPEYLLKIISEYTNSKMYKDAEIAQAYYRRENIEAMKRRDRLVTIGNRGKVVNRVANKKCCGFFAKSVKQLAQYITSNGVSLEDKLGNNKLKDKLGTNFDTTLQKMSLHSLVDGVSWGFWNYDKVQSFRATEFAPLFDEKSGELMSGLRFYQIDSDKPMYIELFELDGITTYKVKSNEVLQESPKKSYKVNVKKDSICVKYKPEGNYSKLPIFPLWANELKCSELTEGLKNDIDLYDRIMSDFGDNLDRTNDIYYVIRNFGGDEPEELIAQIEYYRMIYLENENEDASLHTIEVPYEARRVALELLEKQMYKETQTLNTEELTGGNLTNIAIKVALTDLDLKADLFEQQLDKFVGDLLCFQGIDLQDAEIDFKRRSLINDTEIIDNICKIRDDIDHETALKLNPLIPDKMLDEILNRVSSEQLGIDEKLDNNDGIPSKKAVI